MDQAAILLSKRVKEYVDGRHEGNVNKACLRLGIDDYNSVYRLYHGKVNSPAFFLAIQILRQTDPNNFCDILADLYPKEMKTIAQIRANPGEDVFGTLDRKLGLAFSSKIHFAIYVRALEHDGLKIDDITSDFGGLGLLVANELISAGVIFLESGVLRSDLADKEFQPSMKLVKKHGHLHIDLFQDAAPGFRMENVFCGLNTDGIKEMFQILDEAASKSLKVSKNPKFKGDVMYLSTILGGPMSLPRKEQDQ